MPRQTSRGKMTVRMKVPSPRKRSYRGATNVYRGSGSSPKKRSYTKKTSPRCGSRSSPRCGRSYRGSSSPKRRTYRGTTYRSSTQDLFEVLTEKVNQIEGEHVAALSEIIANLKAATTKDVTEIQEQASEVQQQLKFEQKKTSFFSKLRGNTVSGGRSLLAAIDTLQRNLESTKSMLELYLSEKSRKVKLMDELETQILTLNGLGEIEGLNTRAREMGEPTITFDGLAGIIHDKSFVSTIEEREDFKKWLAMPKNTEADKAAKDAARIDISNALIQEKQAELDRLIATTEEKLDTLEAAKREAAAAAAKEQEKALVLDKLAACSDDGTGDVAECERLIAQAKALDASDADLAPAEAYVTKKKVEAMVPPLELPSVAE